MESNELQELISQGIISNQQGDLIKEFQLKNKLTKQEQKWEWFQNSLFIIWWVSIFLGILSLIALNRDGIADSIKILISMVLTWLTYTLWYYLKYSKGKIKVGWSLLFIWWLLVWATIFLIAQVYNMTTTNDILLWIWMILILPLVYIAKQKEFYRLHMILLSSILAVFFISHKFESIDWRNTIVLYQLFAASMILVWYIHDKTSSDPALNILYKTFWVWLFMISSFIFLLATQSQWFDNQYQISGYIIGLSSIIILMYMIFWYIYKTKELLRGAGILTLFMLIKFYTQLYMVHDIIMIVCALFVIYLWYNINNETLRRQWNLYLYWFLLYLYIRHWYGYVHNFVFFFIWWILLILWWVLYKKLNDIMRDIFIHTTHEQK